MKVIHLISGGDTGGAKTHVHSLLQNLSRSIDVTLVCFRGGPFAEEAAALGIDTRVMDGGFFRALRGVRALIESGGYDIVHCHGSRANLAGALLRRSTKKPVVSTVHSDYRLDYLGRPAAALTYGKLNVFALRHIKYHIGVSDAMRALLISRGFPRATTFAIYNGLDFSRTLPERSRAEFYKRVGADVREGDIVVGAAARLDPVKDLATLVRGFAEAKKSVPGLKLIIAGEGAERPNLESLAASLGVADSVTLAGWLDDMDEYYGALDINTLTSISETFPYAITEGAAHRLPTVSSRVGGIPRLIEDGFTGYLFEPGDYAALGERIARLASDARLRERLGEAIFERAARDFSMEATCREQCAVYREILDREAHGSRAGVLICGAYGMGNAGDEAILDAITAEMRSIDPLMPITVLSRDPEGAEKRLDVDAIHTFNVPGFLRVMRRRTLYINGGGSLIQDVTSRRSLWFYLFTLRAARRCGCRVMMYGCGIGPVRRPGGVRSTRRTLNSCVDIITLREPDSMEELHRFGVEGPELILASDPALTLSPAPAEEIDAEFNSAGADPEGKYICFALRRWPGFEEKAPAFAAAARYAHEKYGLTPAFVSINHKSDGEAAAAVASLMDGVERVFIPGPLPSALAIGVMSRMEIVVSMRLHGLIFAAGQGVPLVGVSYDPKVTAFLRCVDGGCVTLEDLTEDGLCRLIDAAAALREDPAALEASVARLRAIEHKNTASAARLLGKQVNDQ
ncbi:MAG TPA: polysaccharide pyruvyl transferase CsaB [Candidatus Scatomorpha intestinavium]|uniref:Polysaccharide pyruvyl transferase CsaB n=1 Tax=Candidatus Scatomorpha intestinavium TaxID=2840922 RepID=A0A9D0ZBU3_9FIRM|nr:polysaccharide pyruvyl transferase CsaB [Candidatus Scatomorpha intestinavium]